VYDVAVSFKRLGEDAFQRLRKLARPEAIPSLAAATDHKCAKCLDHVDRLATFAKESGVLTLQQVSDNSQEVDLVLHTIARSYADKAEILYGRKLTALDAKQAFENQQYEPASASKDSDSQALKDGLDEFS